MKENEINICYITDDNFCMPTGITMYSIYKNKAKNTLINNYVLCDKVSDKEKEKLYQLQKEDFKINLIDIEEKEDFSKYKIDNITATITAIYKFFIPSFLPDLEKVLYLDGDILVQEDLLDLWNTNIEDKYAAVVQDVLALFCNSGNYFNSGVMLLNLKKMREDDISLKLLEYRKNGYNEMMDQDAFNYIFKDSKYMLPYKYNTAVGLIEQGALGYKECSIENAKNVLKIADNINSLDDLLNKSAIVHYAGIKPWKYRGLYSTDIWMKYYYSSIYKDIELKTEFYYSEVFCKTNTYKFYKSLYSLSKKIIYPFLFLNKTYKAYRRRGRFFKQF